MSYEVLLWVLGAPALACGAILVAAFRPWREATGFAAHWAGANALAAGVAIAFLVGQGWQVDVPPRQPWQWLVYLTAGAAVAMAYGLPAGGRGGTAWTVWAAAAVPAAWLMVAAGVEQSWAWRGMTAGMMVASMAAMDRLSERMGSAVFCVVVGLAAAACAVVLYQSRNETLAQLAMALTACLGVAALLGWWWPAVGLGGGGVLVLGLLLPGLVMSGYFAGSRIPAWCLVIAALAPAAYWLAEVPVAQKFVAPRPLAIRVGVILLTAGVAAGGAMLLA